ncbi:MAG: hypothetical protein ACFFBD_21555 [Candidatus Hodarchaeota archaeon]
MGRTKITFRKLNATGHSTMQLDSGAAYSMALEELNSGNYLYLEPQKKIVTAPKDLNLNKVDEILVMPPVIGG